MYINDAIGWRNLVNDGLPSTATLKDWIFAASNPRNPMYTRGTSIYSQAFTQFIKNIGE